jgi:hypothetical protein
METFKFALAVGILGVILYPVIAFIVSYVLAPYVIREAERIVEG